MGWRLRMVIKDVSGKKLTLGKTMLSEAPFVNGYAVRFTELRRAVREEGVWWNELRLIDVNPALRHEDGYDFVTSINTAERRLGCREFDARTWAKIMRAAGIRKK
jgi:hypothetical protein